VRSLYSNKSRVSLECTYVRAVSVVLEERADRADLCKHWSVTRCFWLSTSLRSQRTVKAVPCTPIVHPPLERRPLCLCLRHPAGGPSECAAVAFYVAAMLPPVKRGSLGGSLDRWVAPVAAFIVAAVAATQKSLPFSRTNELLWARPDGSKSFELLPQSRPARRRRRQGRRRLGRWQSPISSLATPRRDRLRPFELFPLPI